MKFRNILLTSTALLFCTASLSATAVERTFVSGSGSDSNPCTFNLPCLTFQGALGNTSSGGMITAMDAGDFGPVTIKQSVTIDGNNLGSISYNNVSEYGVQILSGAIVTIQNLTINGLVTGEIGIFAVSGGIVTIDNCKIMNFQDFGIYFGSAGNLTVENTRIDSFSQSGEIGIKIYGNGAENVFVRNTVIDASPLASGNYGFLIGSNAGPVMASLQNVAIKGAGANAVTSGNGVTEITNSVITQNGIGVDATNSSTISVASSLITANTNGVCSETSSKIRLDNNDIYDNATAIANCGGIVKTSTTNKTSGTISIPAADVSDSVTF